MDDKRKKFEGQNFFNLGMDYIQREFLDKAEYAFKKAVELDPENALAWAYLSKLFEKKGQTTEAEEAYKKAVKLDNSIDFGVIQRDCRLFEDRNVITGAFRKYQNGRMSTTEFIEFVTNLSSRAIALIANKDSSKRLFKIAVERAAIEKVTQLDFDGLPIFLSQIRIPFNEFVETLEKYTVSALLSDDRTSSYLELLNFLNTYVDEQLQDKVQCWSDIGSKYAGIKTPPKKLFDRATRLLTIIEKTKKADTLEKILSPLRIDTVGVIITESVSRGSAGARHLLSAFKKTQYEIVNTIASCMITVLVIEKQRKPILKFFKMIEDELTKMKHTKKSITRVQEWSKVLSSIDRKMSQSISEYEQILNLLEVIEETKGKYEPTVIAEQCLRLIQQDLAAEVRSQSSVYMESRVLHWYDSVGDKLITKEKLVRWLESIKKAYFKLISITNNQNMKFSDEQRIRLVEIANTMLRFLIISRTNDLIEQTASDQFSRNHLVDVFFPKYYQSFPIPALYALNEFFENPYQLAATIEVRNPKIRIRVDKWKLAAAVSLLGFPALLFTDMTYIDFVVPEYLKTLTLAIKHVEYDLDKFLARYADDDLTSVNLMTTIMRGLSESSATQITRAQIVAALDFGDWDTSLADMIIESKKYCMYCSFELPEGAKTCPNCERIVKDVDFSKATFVDVDPDFYV